MKTQLHIWNQNWTRGPHKLCWGIIFSWAISAKTFIDSNEGRKKVLAAAWVKSSMLWPTETAHEHTAWLGSNKWRPHKSIRRLATDDDPGVNAAACRSTAGEWRAFGWFDLKRCWNRREGSRRLRGWCHLSRLIGRPCPESWNMQRNTDGGEQTKCSLTKIHLLFWRIRLHPYFFIPFIYLVFQPLLLPIKSPALVKFPRLQKKSPSCLIPQI